MKKSILLFFLLYLLANGFGQIKTLKNPIDDTDNSIGRLDVNNSLMSNI